MKKGTIELVTRNFRVYRVNTHEYTVTVSFRREEIRVFVGTTLSECEEFINRHPYGITKAEALTMEI